MNKVLINAGDLEVLNRCPNDEVFTRLHNRPHARRGRPQSCFCCNALLNLLRQKLIGFLRDFRANALLH